MRSKSEMNREEISNLEKASLLALEALEEYSPIPTDGPWHKRHHKAITALRAALAEDAMHRLTDVQQEMERKPLTDEEITRLWVEAEPGPEAFARAIERAHGIGDEE